MEKNKSTWKKILEVLGHILAFGLKLLFNVIKNKKAKNKDSQRRVE